MLLLTSTLHNPALHLKYIYLHINMAGFISITKILLSYLI